MRQVHLQDALLAKNAERSLLWGWIQDLPAEPGRSGKVTIFMEDQENKAHTKNKSIFTENHGGRHLCHARRAKRLLVFLDFTAGAAAKRCTPLF